MLQVFYYKMRQFYYKMRQIYYKTRQLLQNEAIFILNCDSTTRNVAAVSSDESTILILYTLEESPTQFVLQCDQ